MNIQEIIESGIIELYVMNALPEDEAMQVAALAVTHPEIRAEIEDVEAALQNYTQAQAVAPNPELKDLILKRIHGDLPQNQLSSSNQYIETPKLPVEKDNTSGRRTAIWIWAATVAIAGIAFLFQNMNHKKQLTECSVENAKLIENQKLVVELTRKLDILRDADTKEIEMKGSKISPLSKVLVYWNAKEKATLLSIQNLPAPPKGKQYQLWAIVNKKPVDAGVFVYDITAVQPMKAFEKAEAFAVSLEPLGGSVSPTVNDIYTSGMVL